jgi:hypothetical protein
VAIEWDEQAIKPAPEAAASAAVEEEGASNLTAH